MNRLCQGELFPPILGWTEIEKICGAVFHDVGSGVLPLTAVLAVSSAQVDHISCLLLAREGPRSLAHVHLQPLPTATTTPITIQLFLPTTH